MPSRSPRPLSPTALRVRRSFVTQLARDLGFVGRVEYRHVYSRSGGAQYGQAALPQGDLLIVYAEAFERDADPEDYSIAAILAHEVGHHLLRRHPDLIRRMERRISADSEEIIASVIGAIIAQTQTDRDDLLSMAAVRLSQFNVSLPLAVERIHQLRVLLQETLR